MKTGMNFLLWTTYVTEEHYPLFAKLKAVGFDGIEVPLFVGDAAHYGKVRKELDNHGLGCTTVTCVNPQANPISPDANIRRAGLDHDPLGHRNDFGPGRRKHGGAVSLRPG